MIIVCPLSKVQTVLQQHWPSHVVSLLGLHGEMPDFARREDVSHLQLAFNDISVAREGYVLPGEDHIGALLDFVAGWDRTKPMAIHCWAGISRSTAACFIAHCALTPERDELELARYLRASSPSASPNRLMVELADRALKRKGRMSAAIASIGRGANAWEGEVFKMAIDR